MPELNPRAATLSRLSSASFRLSSKSRSTSESARQPSTLTTPDRVVLHRQRSECINIHRLARQMLRGNKARLTSSTAPGPASPSRKASFSSPFNTRHFSRRNTKAWFQLNWDRHGGKRCKIWLDSPSRNSHLSQKDLHINAASNKQPVYDYLAPLPVPPDTRHCLHVRCWVP